MGNVIMLFNRVFWAVCFLCFALHVSGETSPVRWVADGDDGHLHYQTTGKGDRILDFSHAGYGGGGVKLPAVPVQKTIAPSGGDDSLAFQAAIDAVAAMPLKDGFRGAVLLAPGTFHCASPIIISQNGVVLRGSGADNQGTTIEMTGSPHVCVEIKGKSGVKQKYDSSSVIPITDVYVPSGALGFSVRNADDLRVGDVIYIRRPVTESWIHFMGMDRLVRSGKPQVWMRANGQISYERIIRAITDNRITLDVPLPDAIDASFSTPEVATVVKIAQPERIKQCGIESLQIISPPPEGTLKAKNNDSASLNDCEDCWLKDMVMRDTLGNVNVEAGARRITIEGVHAIHTATVKRGAGYPADFSIRGSQVLIDRCSSSGNGSFYVATLDPSATLNVVLNCNFSGNGAIQPHMHWSTALLVDSSHLPDGKIEFINRGTAGSGHGWAIGWAVAWNCAAKDFSIEQPPGAINWCIGCTGTLRQGKHGFLLPGSAVLPHSLYLAQLNERLGNDALKNIGY